MSFPPSQTVADFIPNYVVKSYYLPSRVQDGNTAQTAQLVHFHLNLVTSI